MFILIKEFYINKKIGEKPLFFHIMRVYTQSTALSNTYLIDNQTIKKQTT